MVETLLLHEGMAVLITFIIVLFIGIAIGIDVGGNTSGASVQSIILIVPLIISILGIFYNYTARDETIQYLIQNKTDKNIKEMNTTEHVKKIIIYNYLKLKKDNLNKKLNEGE